MQRVSARWRETVNPAGLMWCPKGVASVALERPSCFRCQVLERSGVGVVPDVEGLRRCASLGGRGKELWPAVVAGREAE